MIAVEILVTKLAALSYSVEGAREDVPDLGQTTIYISYATIAPQHIPNPLDNMLLNRRGEDLFQSFDIQIVCPSAEFPVIWSAIYKLMYGWNPTSKEVNAAGFIKGEGGKLGMSNGYMHWVDRWYISFPTLNVAL